MTAKKTYHELKAEIDRLNGEVKELEDGNQHWANKVVEWHEKAFDYAKRAEKAEAAAKHELTRCDALEKALQAKDAEIDRLKATLADRLMALAEASNDTIQLDKDCDMFRRRAEKAEAELAELRHNRTIECAGFIAGKPLTKLKRRLAQSIREEKQ